MTKDENGGKDAYLPYDIFSYGLSVLAVFISQLFHLRLSVFL